MPALILLIIIGTIALWFLCSCLFRPIGRFIGSIMKDIRDATEDENTLGEKGEDVDEEKW